MLSDRNTTAHIYDEEVAIPIASRIVSYYLGDIQNLYDAIRRSLG